MFFGFLIPPWADSRACPAYQEMVGAGELVVASSTDAEALGLRIPAPTKLHAGRKIPYQGTTAPVRFHPTKPSLNLGGDLPVCHLCSEILDCDTVPFVLNKDFDSSLINGTILVYSYEGIIQHYGYNRVARELSRAGVVGLIEIGSGGMLRNNHARGEYLDCEPRDDDVGIIGPHTETMYYDPDVWTLITVLAAGHTVTATLSPTVPNLWITAVCGWWVPARGVLACIYLGVSERAFFALHGHIMEEGVCFDSLAQAALLIEAFGNFVASVLMFEFRSFYWEGWSWAAWESIAMFYVAALANSTLLLAVFWNQKVSETTVYGHRKVRLAIGLVSIRTVVNLYMVCAEWLEYSEWKKWRIPGYNMATYNFVMGFDVIIGAGCALYFLHSAHTSHKSLSNAESEFPEVKCAALRVLMKRVVRSALIYFMGIFMMGMHFAFTMRSPYWSMLCFLFVCLLFMANSVLQIDSFASSNRKIGPLREIFRATIKVVYGTHIAGDEATWAMNEIIAGRNEAALRDARDESGNTMLFSASTVEMINGLLDAGVNPHVRNRFGKTAYEVQSLTLRAAIREKTHFCGRFAIPPVVTPEHATDTSIVIRATDTAHDDDAMTATRDVALKLMKYKRQFERELEQRKGLDPRYVTEVICTSEDLDKWVPELRKLPNARWRGFKYGIVMPAAERNLAVVLLQERVDLETARAIFLSLADALNHLHNQNIIHCDLKPSNLMRTAPTTRRMARWQIIDFDGAVKRGDPIGAKSLSTAFVGPETTSRIVELGTGGVRGREEPRQSKSTTNSVSNLPEEPPNLRRRRIVPLALRNLRPNTTSGEGRGAGKDEGSAQPQAERPLSPPRKSSSTRARSPSTTISFEVGANNLKANPSFDLWSFGVCLFHAVAQKPLFEADKRDCLNNMHERAKLANWGPTALSDALFAADLALNRDRVGARERLIVLHLIAWLLQRDPGARPQSCPKMLSHPFFDSLPNTPKRGVAEETYRSRPKLTRSERSGSGSSRNQLSRQFTPRSVGLGGTSEQEEKGTGKGAGDSSASDLEKELAEIAKLAERLTVPNWREPGELLQTPRLYIAASLGYYSSAEAILIEDPTAATVPEPFLQRPPLHAAATGGAVAVVRLLLSQAVVDADALDGAGFTADQLVKSTLQEGAGDAMLAARLNTVRQLLKEANLTTEVLQQVTEGVTVKQGQDVRDYMQSLVHGPVENFWPKVMISYATGTRNLNHGYERDLDGDGCGLGMQYAHLVARALDRRGVECFSGLHVAGGDNWRQVCTRTWEGSRASPRTTRRGRRGAGQGGPAHNTPHCATRRVPLTTYHTTRGSISRSSREQILCWR